MTPPVLLREVLDEDLPVFFVNQLDVAAIRRVGYVPRDRPAFDAHWAKTRVDPANLLRTVVVEARVAGNIGSFVRAGKREVGYWIGREHWARGIATAALTAFLALDPVRPLHGFVSEHNAASARVLVKCGFVREGGISEPAADGSGRTVIHHEYVLVGLAPG